jgi:hypothetical protein
VRQTVRASMAVPVWIKNEIKRISCLHNETMLETLQRWIMREMQDNARGQSAGGESREVIPAQVPPGSSLGVNRPS